MSKQRSLESFRIFPYIAWTLVVGFALFVYQLTTELSIAQSSLAERTNMLETRANQAPHTITDFTP